MSDSPPINVNEQDMSDTSFSSSGGQKPLVHKDRNRFLVALVVITSLLLIWGVSLLPTIFYFNKLPAPPPMQPPTNISNQTMPKPLFPCSHPLIFNPKTVRCDAPCPWVTLTDTEDFALKVVDNFSIAVSLFSFVIILATWIRIKQLRCFPHIIPLYIQGLQAAITLILAIANGMGREKSFCSGKFYSESLANPTTFCTAQGVLIQYLSGVLGLWFVVYNINLLQVGKRNRKALIITPFRFFLMICSDSLVKLKGKRYKVQHVICSLICWLLPFIPVGIVLGSKSTSYQVYIMRYCYPTGTDTGFFTTTFITEVSQGVGCTCLLFVVYKLFMLRDISAVIGEQAELRKKKMDKVVQRLVFLMFAYAAITALTYIPICVLQQHSKILAHHTEQYFGCLMFSPPDHCPRTYEKYTFAATFVIQALTTALFALTTVCFLAFNKQSRKLWSFWWFRIKKCFGE